MSHQKQWVDGREKRDTEKGRGRKAENTERERERVSEKLSRLMNSLADLLWQVVGARRIAHQKTHGQNLLHLFLYINI